jgi:hypothetical protein
MDKFSLIVPVAADKVEYNDLLPYVFGLDDDGIIICIKSIMGLNLKDFDHIYFTILHKHDERFFVGDSLRLQFRRLGIANAEVVVLEKPTTNQAETIYQTILQKKLQGAIFIKDGDSCFNATIEPLNAVTIFPIEELEFIDPRDKSYVAVDDMSYITNIIEKRVIGHFISAGGYGFASAAEYCKYYERLKDYGHLYLSHIIYAMLLNKCIFRPIHAQQYQDWGNKNLYSLLNMKR